jgi:membrane protein required for beta-lactamase induction
LQYRAADPRVDRLCETVVAVHTLDGDVTAALERLRATALEDARRDRELGRLRSATRFAAWLALLPVFAVVSGRASAGVVAFVIGAAVCAWTAAATQRPSPVNRVFRGTGTREVFGTQQ